MLHGTTIILLSFAYLGLLFAIAYFADMNDVEQLLIGAPGSGAAPRRFAGVCAQVVGGASCTVTVVRARAEG